MKKIILSLLSITGLLAIGTPATAGIVSADLRVEMNLEYCCATPADASISEVLGAVTGTGPELTVADRTINPAGWGGHIAIDINGSGTGFTLFNDDGDNVFQSAIVTISNIVSDMGDILNVTMADNTLFTTDTGTFSTFLSYTADSITFSVLIDDMTDGSDDVWTITDAGTALFDIEFGSRDVPAPSSGLALIGLGLAGIWMRRRRRA